VKVIFSRKGFDSANGGVPSPIFPDGRLCYLPIPSDGERLRFGQVAWEGQNLGVIVENVTNGRQGRKSGVHLDPDINPTALPRMAGWKGLFGQTGAAQSHLARNGVDVGDIFLFFGWFRQVRSVQGRLRFDAAEPHLHALFGWMQVGAVLAVDDVPPSKMPWARYHPHFGRKPDRRNTVYVAAKRVSIPGLKGVLPGSGLFRSLKPSLTLTAPDSSRSRWRLPGWFQPSSRKKALSYHSDLSRWHRGKNCVYLDTVGRGQEFVLDCEQYAEANGWLASLFDDRRM
jgi:hypothetical protein